MPVEIPKSVVLVTGGTGLVGYAIRHVIESEPVGSRVGRREGEAWVFVGSKDADLRLVSSLQPLRHSIRVSLALLPQ
jgi:GDP-L-fucose synthase